MILFDCYGALYLLCPALLCAKIFIYTNNPFSYFHAPTCSQLLAVNDVKQDDDSPDVDEEHDDLADPLDDDPEGSVPDQVPTVPDVLEEASEDEDKDVSTQYSLEDRASSHSVVLSSAVLLAWCTKALSLGDPWPGVLYDDTHTCHSVMTWSLVSLNIISCIGVYTAISQVNFALNILIVYFEVMAAIDDKTERDEEAIEDLSNEDNDDAHEVVEDLANEAIEDQEDVDDNAFAMGPAMYELILKTPCTISICYAAVIITTSHVSSQPFNFPQIFIFNPDILGLKWDLRRYLFKL